VSGEREGPRVLLRSEQCDGTLSVVESAVPAGFGGPTLHRHDFDETFYVMEGELIFQLRDKLSRVGAGGLAFAPRGVPHTFANFSDSSARYLIVCTPAGFERYFARMAADRQGVEPPQWAMQPIPEVTHVGPQIDPAAVRRLRTAGTETRADG
jgi:mannose-6-phosphate isomerase-like protein (cupin superfamily)